MGRTKAQKAELLERYERASELPMALLALLLIPLLVVPLVVDLSDGLSWSFFAIDVFIWGVFFADIAPRRPARPVWPPPARQRVGPQRRPRRSCHTRWAKPRQCDLNLPRY